MVRALLRLTPALIAFGLFLEACDKVEVVAPDPPRVTISPAVITITIGERSRLTASVVNGTGAVAWTSSDPGIVSVDAGGEITGLAVGSAAISARVGSGVGTTQVTVRAATSVVLDRPVISFTAAPGGVAGPESVEITAPGPEGMSGLTVGVAYTPGQPQGWLRTALSSTSTPASLLVSADARNLAVGTYSATIDIAGDGAAGQSISVTLQVVGAPPTIALNTDSVGFAANEAGTKPAPQQIAVTNSGTGTLGQLSLSPISYGTGQPTGWLTATLSAASAPSAIVLDADVASLVQGVYTATLQVASPDAANSPRTVRVTFSVTAPLPIIALNPTTLAFTAVQGGPPPTNLQVSITNGGVGVLSGLRVGEVYTTPSRGWITASLSSGSAPAVADVAIDHTGLLAGNYSGFVQVEASGAANTPLLVPVSLTVTDPPVMALSRPTVLFSATAGLSDPPTANLIVSNAGGSILDGLTIDSIVYASGQRPGWLSGSLNFPLAPSTLALDATLNPPGGPLAPGTYDATAYVGSTAAGVTNSPQVLPVAFFVTNTDPVASIARPSNGQAFTAGAAITFDGTGSDAEDGTLTGPSLVWSSDLDGQIGTGTSFTISTLSLGSHTVTLTATDSQGATGSAQITIAVDSRPAATITAPADSAVFLQGSTVVFTGSGTDPEDGALTGTSLVWLSSQDGAMGTGTALPFAALSAGWHGISLIATDSQGASDTASVTIRINAVPVAQAGVDQVVADADGSGDEAITFDGSGSTDAEGPLVAYDWSEAGTNVATGITPTANLSVGAHTVVLTVTDADGAVDTDTVNVSIGANGAPVAMISAPLSGAVINEGVPVTFDGSGSDPEEGALSGSSLSWTSDVDGLLGSGVPLQATGLKAGPHVVSLSATDGGGAIGVATVSVRINALPTADAGPDQTAIADADNSGDEVVRLDGSGSFDPEGPLVSWDWTTAAVGIPSGVSPIVTLPVGQHTISLVVTDGDGAQTTDDVVVTIGANSGPTASISTPADGTVSPLGAPVTFSGAGTDPEDGALTGASLVWSSNLDGPIGSGGSLVTSTLSAGSHTITLTASDSGGFTGSDAIKVHVNAPPTANAGPDQMVSDANGDGSELVALDGSNSTDPEAPIANYAWTEGATPLATGPNPTVGLSVGVHTIRLTVTDRDGSAAVDDVVVTVGGNTAPTASITAPSNGAVFPLGAFVRLSGSGIDAEDGPVAGSSLSWVSSLDGSLGSGSAITATSLRSGAHVITLVARDAGGLTGSAAVSIRVNAPPSANAGLDQNVTDVDGGGTELVTLDGSGSSDPEAPLASYIWSEGGSQIATGVNPTVTLTLGLHPITLTVTDTDGSTSTDVVDVTVSGNTAPAATIQTPGNGSVFTRGTAVSFSGTGTDPEQGALAGAALIWTSNLDGPIGTGTPVSTAVLSAGAHTVTLTATDAGGLTGTDAISIRINTAPIANAGPDQTLTDADGSGDEPVTLNGSGSSDAEGILASYVWTEGANTVAIGVTPTVNLPVGAHALTLTVTDGDGAQSTDGLTVTVVGNSVPTASITGPASGLLFARGTAIDFTGSGFDAEDGTLSGASLVWTSSLNGLLGTGAALTTSALSSGTHTIALTATDGGGLAASDAIIVRINAAPTANAGPDQSLADADGSGGEPVTLDGSSSLDSDGTIVSWGWTTPGATIPSGVTPTVTLPIGTHTITLTVTDSDGGTDTDDVVVTIGANQAPIPTITAPANGLMFAAGTVIDFTGSATDAEDGALAGTALAWTSSLDGPLGTGALLSTGSLSSGSHIVTLTATDGGGRTGTTNISLRVNAPPVADAGPDQVLVDADNGGTEVVALDGSGSIDAEGPVASYAWSESGTQIAAGSNPSVALGVGVHLITLTVTDGDGATATDDVVVTVTANTAPTASVSAPADGSVFDFGSLVTLTGSGTDAEDGTLVGASLGWSSNLDGVLGTGAALSLGTMTVGTHTVTLTATDSGGLTGTDAVSLRINGVPIADAGPDQTLSDPDNSGDELVSLDGSASSDAEGVLASYSWSELGTPIATGSNPVVNLGVGVHTITLAVTDSDGAASTDDVVVTIGANQAPSASITAPQDGAVFDVGVSVTFTGSGNDPEDGPLAGGALTWASNVDGALGAGGSISAGSLTAGAHTITLTATDSGGLTGSDVITIRINNPPVANAGPDQTASDLDNSGTETVLLDGSGSSDSEGALAAYTWSEGGSPIASGVNPSVALTVGVHVVTLTVTDADGSTATDDVVVTIGANQAPTASITSPLSGAVFNLGAGVTLNGTGTDVEDGALTAGALAWSSSLDGAIGTGASVLTSGLSAGSHVITLTATDSGGLTGTDVITIEINQPPSANAGPDQPSVTDTNLSGDEAVTLDGSLSTDVDGTIVSWDWATAAATIPSGVSPVVTLPVGVHTITLTVTDNGGATNTDDVVVTVAAGNQVPTADAGPDQNVTDTDLSGDESVTLDGSASVDPGGSIVSWDWATAAATIPSGVSPVVTLPVGVHTITLTVTDNGGATDTDDVVVTVAPGNVAPTANAGPDQPTVTDGDDSGDASVTLDGSASTDSDGTVVSWDWTTAAATIPSGSAPVVTLPIGVHTITLTVTDDDGATDTDDVVVTVLANQAPTANAGPDQNVTDTDLSGDESVTLDGAASTDSDGTIVSWDWTTAAATIPSGVSPVVTLPVGVHTITLTVTDNGGATNTDDVVVTVAAGNPAPTADAGPDQNVTDTDLSGDESVTLDGSASVDPGGSIVSWDWATAAATIPSGVSPVVTLPVGVHTITLTVTDNGGATDTDDVVVTVAPGNVAPTANAGPDQPTVTDGDDSGDASVTLDGSASTDSDGTVVSWDWTTAAATIPSGSAPVVTLPIGVHTITLTVTDDDGATDTDDVVVTVLANQAPTANAGPDQNVTDTDLSGDESVTLDGAASTDSDGTIVSWDWTTAAATIPSGVSPVVTLPVGVHTITLTVTDNGGATNTDDVVVTVAAGNPAPTADAGPDQNVTDTDLSGDESVTLDGSASVDPGGSIVSWDWATAAATIPSGVSPVVTLPVGVHTITLTVTDNGGATDTDDVVVTVAPGNVAPTANAGPDQPTVTDGDDSGDASVTLDGSASTDSDGTVVSWDWTTAAATIPSGSAPVVTLPIGVHTITLTVTDDDGATDTDDVVVTVLANQAPTANAGPGQNVTDTDLSGDESVTLDGAASTDSDGTIVSWDWTTAAATIPSGVSPVVTLPVGVHTITLTVTDNGGATNTDDVVVTVAAGNPAPTADAGPDQNVTDTDLSGDESVTLDGSASVDPGGSIVSWDWATAAATIPSGVSPVVTLPVGVHTITLTVTDNGGATDTDDVVVTVAPGNVAPTANAGPDQPTVTDGDDSGDASVTLDGSASMDSDGTVVSWDWTTAAATIPSGSAPVVTLPIGVHTITLTVTDDDGATDTDDVVVTVLANQAPTANAGPGQNVTDADLSGDESVTLDGAASTDSDGTIVSWDWTTAAATIPSGVSPVVTLPVGVHTITLTVTDNGGATNTDDVVVTVAAGNPAPTADAGPDQNVTDTDLSGDESVTLDGSASVDPGGSIVSWDWATAAATIPSGVSPVVTLPVGVHTITLTVTDNGGATDTDDVVVTVAPGNVAPTANAGPDQPTVTDGDDSGDASVTLDGSASTDSDGTVVSWDWTTAAATIPSGSAPVVTLPIGVHTITLTVTDDDGATDTDDVVVTVLANQAPTADAGPDQPSVGDVDGNGTESVTLDGSGASDVDGTIVSWDWSAPGVTIPSGVNPIALLAVGTHTITLTVTDDGGATATDDVVVTVNANTAPIAAITSPTNGLSVPQGTQITFAGSGTDTEEGALTGGSLVWSSDLDGQIGTGLTFSNSTLSVGTHTITLTVTDAGLLVGTAVITVTIT